MHLLANECGKTNDSLRMAGNVLLMDSIHMRPIGTITVPEGAHMPSTSIDAF